MSEREDPGQVVRRFEEFLEELVGPLSDDEKPVIGDASYVYVRCQLFRRLFEELLSGASATDCRESKVKELFRVLAEADNMACSFRNLHQGLEKIVDKLPD